MANLEEEALRAFEAGGGHLDAEAQERLCKALEANGAVFLPEDKAGGPGVRLKFTSRDVRAINRLEGEGGLYASDDV